MEILLLAMLLGIIPAMIASKKGRSGFFWWLYGSLLFIIALPHALLIEPTAGVARVCPFCAETVKVEAIVCPHCQRDIPRPPAASDAGPQVTCRQCNNAVPESAIVRGNAEAACPACGAGISLQPGPI